MGSPPSRLTSSPKAGRISSTRSKTARFSSSLTLPKGRPRWPTAGPYAAPPSCIKCRTTPLFQGPSPQRRASEPISGATSRFVRCKLISGPDLIAHRSGRSDGTCRAISTSRDQAMLRSAMGFFDSAPGGLGLMEKIPMTAEGYSALESELKHCQQVERPRIIQQITDARTHGDLSENAEYHAAKESQSINEGRIAELEDKMARAEVIDVSKLSGDTITFGATVTLVDEDTEKKAVWQIVGEPEADAKKGKISITSPLARALVGKKKGAQVEVVTPGGAKAYEVMKVEWK